MTYDNKFKLRAIEYYEEGNTIRQTAQVFKISPNTLNTWLKQYREHKNFASKPRTYTHGKLKEQALLDFLKDNPDAYQYEMAEHFGVSQMAIWKALRRFGVTRKKDKAV
ncbi:MAG: IS630 transposase-related protein [Defluviitaleaceae bacterium]|nr:IS630 transposase-related protein [Defluviitaleaceae bacterium]